MAFDAVSGTGIDRTSIVPVAKNNDDDRNHNENAGENDLREVPAHERRSRRLR